MSVAYSVSNATAKDGAAAVDFSVRRSGTYVDLASATTIAYATSDVTAKAGSDYIATSGSLQFAPSQTELVVQVMIINEAYATSTSTTFLLDLGNFGSATGTIAPDAQANTTQIYLYLPEDDESVIVPTSDVPGDNLKYQALYAGFSDPDPSTVEMPLAYLRIGHARSDMNDYERVVINGDAYVPAWNGYESDGTPIEGGALIHMMLPRGVSRPREDVDATEGEDPDEAMQDNGHLDGIFLHSNKNYIATVAGNKNEVVQGDSTTYVGGEVREQFMGPAARWSYMGGPGYLRWAEGIDTVAGLVWNYSISRCFNLGVSADWTIDYRFGGAFSATAAADVSVSTALSYGVSNSFGLEVKGLEYSTSCNIFGEYDVELPGFSKTSTEKDFSKTTSVGITLSVDPATAQPRSAGVAAAAIANMAAAVGAAAPGMLVDFDPDGSFYDNITVEDLSSTYNDLFSVDVPATVAGLGLLMCAALACAGYSQKVLDELPSVGPKIQMTPFGMMLSCGATIVDISAAGVTIDAPVFEMSAAEMIFDGGSIILAAGGTAVIDAPLITAQGTFGITGSLSVTEFLTTQNLLAGQIESL